MRQQLRFARPASCLPLRSLSQSPPARCALIADACILKIFIDFCGLSLSCFAVAFISPLSSFFGFFFFFLASIRFRKCRTGCVSVGNLPHAACLTPHASRLIPHTACRHRNGHERFQSQSPAWLCQTERSSHADDWNQLQSLSLSLSLPLPPLAAIASATASSASIGIAICVGGRLLQVAPCLAPWQQFHLISLAKMHK